jgi:hypothetical protein
MVGVLCVLQSLQSDEFVLTKPEWMNGNPKDFSEEQKKEAREFVAKERQVAEEKAKKRATLETELKGIRAAVDDAVARFDDAVAQLYQQWLQAQAGICTTEMAITHLCLGENTRAMFSVLLRLVGACRICVCDVFCKHSSTGYGTAL